MSSTVHPRCRSARNDIGKQPTGVAEARPYLYFTVAALDGIQDLFSEQTRLRGLLDVEQQRLSRALQLRWDVTRQFWAKIATFGGGDRWPIEDLPWTTTDGSESDYYSLLLTSIVIAGCGVEQARRVTTSTGSGACWKSSPSAAGSPAGRPWMTRRSPCTCRACGCG